MGARSISDRRSWRRGAGIFVLALLGVLAIALLQRSGWFDPLNIAAMKAAGAGRAAAPWITTVMVAASAVGDTIGRLFIMAAVASGLLYRRQRHAAQWLALVVVGGTLLNTGLKQIFAAPRPDLLPHIDIVHSYSFPSGHSAGTMILFGALAMLMHHALTRHSHPTPLALSLSKDSARTEPKGRGKGLYALPYLAAALIIALIGTSRVWLGVHWPSDVLAGWVEGLGWLCLWRHWLPAGRGQEQRVA
ncbi:phosphatase PAP2 family protein [Novosphingobium sp. Chol11]|uniref:phosphatase PAP2 family protein n=1 Tax=Novosphingobium sp. Chol11 TaxID=1385763 RepID=UPI000BE3CAAB|nr:phosphatase PAP2 family protein [Novosphingobium sp. Chol11]